MLLLRANFYVLYSTHTVYLCFLFGSEYKERYFTVHNSLVFYNRDGVCLLLGTD